VNQVVKEFINIIKNNELFVIDEIYEKNVLKKKTKRKKKMKKKKMIIQKSKNIFYEKKVL
jgi:hypothetical protein